MKLPTKLFLLLIFLALSFVLFNEYKKKSELSSDKAIEVEKTKVADLPQDDKKEQSEQAFDLDLSSLNEDDIFLGNKNSGVVMIEYDSLTCPHCKEFHDKIFDNLKTKYIDSGKILYISRAFPTDGMSFRLSLAVMCGETHEDKFKLRTLVFNNQQAIYKAFEGANFEDKSEKNLDIIKNKAESALKNFVTIFEMAGFDKTKIEQCMNPEYSTKNRDILLAQSGKAFKSPYKINSAPTFLINGKIYNGVHDLKFWEQIIDNELEKVNSKEGAEGK